MPIKKLEIEIKDCGAFRHNGGMFGARFKAAKKAWELRTGKAYGEQALAKTA